MALNFLRRATMGAAAPSTAPGERIYAIGDVHGRLDLLTELLGMIDRHAAALPDPQATHVVQLGDFIDRGPQSREVMRYLFELQQRTDQLVVLQGNHEEVMTRALAGDPRSYKIWRGTGGGATMRSFGIDPPRPGADQGDTLDQVRAVVPGAWIDWMARLPLTARSGDYFFCHAGIRPGVPLKRQAKVDLLWIGDDFLDDPADHGAMIIHGHTITDGVDQRHNRIGIDTGAYKTGVLTALYLEGTARQVIATG